MERSNQYSCNSCGEHDLDWFMCDDCDCYLCPLCIRDKNWNVFCPTCFNDNNVECARCHTWYRPGELDEAPCGFCAEEK